MSIYLDHAATTPTDPQVIEAMCRCMRESCANPSAAYGAAGAARREMRLARQTFSRMLGCDMAEVFFTSGGTESNNWALSLCRGKHAVVSAVEHASVLEAAKAYAASVTLVQPDQHGVIRPEAVEAAIRPDTALISVQWANNETGVLQPVAQISAVARKRRIPFHADAVQAFGHVNVDARLCDLLSLSAHKFYGPMGAGCLYVRSGLALPAFLRGGGQESGQRAGTENIPAICGLRAAAELAGDDLESRAARERALLDGFVQNLGIPGARVLGEKAPRLPGVTALHLPGLLAEKVIAELDLRGMEVSGGAACASHSGKPSHVYRAMGLSPEEAACVIRLSIGRSTTKEALAQCAQALREIAGV